MTNSLRTVFEDLASDSSALADFDGDAEAFLAANGFPGLSDELMAEAIGNTADLLDPDLAEHLSPYVMATSPVPLDLEPMEAAEGLGLLSSATPADSLDEPSEPVEDASAALEEVDELDAELDAGFGTGSDGDDEPSATVDDDSVDPVEDSGDRTFGEGFEDVLGDPLDEFDEPAGLSFDGPELDLLDDEPRDLDELGD